MKMLREADILMRRLVPGTPTRVLRLGAQGLGAVTKMIQLPRRDCTKKQEHGKEDQWKGVVYISLFKFNA